MNFIEVIGFLVVMLLFLLLIMKQARDERRRREEHPEAYIEELEEQEAALKQLIESLQTEEEKEELPPPVPVEEELKIEVPTPLRLYSKKRKEVFRDPYKEKKPGTEELGPYHEEAYVILQKQQARVNRLLGKAESLKDAIILKEILGPPKGL